MTYRTSIPGYRIKNGKVVKSTTGKSVSQRIGARKRKRYVRKGTLR
jgi:hypothetical protein